MASSTTRTVLGRSRRQYDASCAGYSFARGITLQDFRTKYLNMEVLLFDQDRLHFKSLEGFISARLEDLEKVLLNKD